MKKQPPDSSRKWFLGWRPAIAVEVFLIALVVCLVLFGKLGVWLLNAVKKFVGQ
ncbi:hypothetical protein [Limisphaera sp. VF-2]|jgi:hypothetical protein|uniref:hypothetical protein n=1 Tax=Limisphaera sp. VF-2 TaxID=3400418 RepID=UPI003C22C44A